MKRKIGLVLRTGEPFLPICDQVQPIRDRSSFEGQRHRLEVSAMKFGLSERDRVRRGKSNGKQSDEGLHGFSNLDCCYAVLIVVFVRFTKSCVHSKSDGNPIGFMIFTVFFFLMRRASCLTCSERHRATNHDLVLVFAVC